MILVPITLLRDTWMLLTLIILQGAFRVAKPCVCATPPDWQYPRQSPMAFNQASWSLTGDADVREA